MDRETKKRIPNQREKILDALRESGKEGLINSRMSKIALNYKARIQELYELGYVIDVHNLKGGLYRYVLLEEPEVELPKPKRAIDLLKEVIEVQYYGSIDAAQLDAVLDKLNLQVVRRYGSHKKDIEKQLTMFEGVIHD